MLDAIKPLLESGLIRKMLPSLSMRHGKLNLMKPVSKYVLNYEKSSHNVTSMIEV